MSIITFKERTNELGNSDSNGYADNGYGGAG